MPWSAVEVAWMAGLMEGEGSFITHRSSHGNVYPRVTITMTDPDVIDRIAALWGATSGLNHRTPRRNPSGNGFQKQQYRARLTGQRALDLMEAVRPLMGDRRGAKIDELLREYRPAAIGV